MPALHLGKSILERPNRRSAQPTVAIILIVSEEAVI
jgi:hypothetical protein